MELRQDEEVYGTGYLASLRKSWTIKIQPAHRLTAIALRSLLFAITITLFLLADAVSGVSEAASCTSLQRQLARLDSNGNNGSADRYREAAASQREQIDKVRNKMEGYGCSGTKGVFKREAHPSCGGLRSTLRKMKGNLRALDRKVGTLSKSSGTERQRRAIKRALKRNQCDNLDRREANNSRDDGSRRATILEQIFGVPEQKRRREQAREDRRELERERQRVLQQRNDDEPATEDILRNYNTVRTVCVRRCDGYYFPVSFSTTKSRVAEDAEACSNLCPGAQMDMYFHRTKGESPEQMISLADGAPYSELPNAFAFQKSYDPDCSCNYRLLAREQESTAELLSPEELADRERANIARMATPAWRIDQGQDPETIANSAGGLDDDAFKNLNPATKQQQVVENRRIRVIGEAFLPAQ